MAKFPTRRDPRLDWVSRHDDNSLNFLIRPKLGEVEVRPFRYKAGPTLNQRREGACVGFGWTQELMTSPRPFTPPSVEYANEYARGYYRECLANDEYAGEEDEGTSVLAGAQTARRRGHIGEYRWATSLEDMRDTLCSGKGPVVIGIPWYEDMYETRASGLVNVGGPVVGGHCLLVDEYHPGKRLRHEDYDKRFEVYGVHNSWDDDYGVDGRAYILAPDMRELIKTWGEMCIPTQRKMVRF